MRGVYTDLGKGAEEQESGGRNPSVRQSRKLATDFSFVLYGSFTERAVRFCG